MDFSQGHPHVGAHLEPIYDLPRDVTSPCPLAGCPSLLTANVLQRNFMGVDAQMMFPGYSPLNIMESQPEIHNQ